MISENESRAIKYIRVGSMSAIVICHILQSYANRWAFVFNIGVQVFLVLSGYLYGKKIVTNWKKWAVGRVRRVYVPMFLFLIIVLPLYLFFHREIFSWKAYALNYLNLQGIPFVMGGVYCRESGTYGLLQQSCLHTSQRLSYNGCANMLNGCSPYCCFV